LSHHSRPAGRPRAQRFAERKSSDFKNISVDFQCIFANVNLRAARTVTAARSATGRYRGGLFESVGGGSDGQKTIDRARGSFKTWMKVAGGFRELPVFTGLGKSSQQTRLAGTGVVDRGRGDAGNGQHD
jgi:hypothetical protein